MRGWLPILAVMTLVARTSFADDDLAAEMARTGKHTITTGRAEVMDGGYRGKIRLLPQMPTGPYKKHLTWTRDAMATIDNFFTSLASSGPDGKATLDYRWTELTFKYVRSPGKRTPSAYATGWSITYNVNGALLTSAAGVLETLFHELFHNNDFGHHDWSAKTLQRDYDAIIRKCKTSSACLAPYAPNTTKVRATGTYYAFQPNNGSGVHEYAAELAVRYFREQTQMMRDKKLAGPAFKCGTVENKRSWDALTTEFFGGADHVPPCS